jgi:hapalindole biogenesis HpiC1 cyclase-like protein
MLRFTRFHHAWSAVPAKPGRSSSRLAMLAGSLILFHGAAYATTVFSSNFSDSNNFGEVGGGILTGSASDVNINQGPWQGSYTGVLGLLAPPEDEISSGAANISGIVGVNLLGLGLTDNSGWFFQNTGLSYLPNTTYTLTADISSGSLLTLGVLSNDGVGIGLTAGGDSLVGASTDPGAVLTIQLLSGSIYQMSYQFVTGGSTPSGALGIRLFDQPEGLLTASLLPSVTFSNVSLDASSGSGSSTVPEPASLGLTGAALLAAGLYKRTRKATA